MTGKQLKEIASLIPDDAEIHISINNDEGYYHEITDCRIETDLFMDADDVPPETLLNFLT